VDTLGYLLDSSAQLFPEFRVGSIVRPLRLEWVFLGTTTILVLDGILFCTPRFSSPDISTIGCGMDSLLLVGMISAVPYFGV
jgi:hypothetical protein